jgi:hypothetical protein
VRAWLERDEPEVAWPATSTIGELFDREGLTIKRRLRRWGLSAAVRDRSGDTRRGSRH